MNSMNDTAFFCFFMIWISNVTNVVGTLSHLMLCIISDDKADVSVLLHPCDFIPNISFVFIQAWLMGSGSRMSLYQRISVSLPLSWHHMLTRGDTQSSPPVSPKSSCPALKLTLEPQDCTMFRFTSLTFCTRKLRSGLKCLDFFTFLTDKPERAIFSENVFELVLEVKRNASVFRGVMVRWDAKMRWRRASWRWAVVERVYHMHCAYIICSRWHLWSDI